MDLKKRSTGDWDVLAKNTDMIIGDGNEEQGLNLCLFYPVIITVYPQEGRARVEVYYRTLRQSMKFEMPLAILHESEMLFEWALGILHEQEGIIIEIPLAKLVEQVLEITMPLKIKPIELHIQVSKKGETQFVIKSLEKGGKPRRKTIKTLQALREYLKKSE